MAETRTVVLLCCCICALFFTGIAAAQPTDPSGDGTGDTAQEETPSNQTGEEASENGEPPSFVGGLVDAVTPDFLGDLFRKLPVPDFLRNWFT